MVINTKNRASFKKRYRTFKKALWQMVFDVLDMSILEGENRSIARRSFLCKHTQTAITYHMQSYCNFVMFDAAPDESRNIRCGRVSCDRTSETSKIPPERNCPATWLHNSGWLNC